MHSVDVDYIDVTTRDGHSSKTKDHDAVEVIKQIANRNAPTAINATVKQCTCKCANKRERYNNSDCVDQGWEGSAMVDHGSILTFGCLTFVFSVVNSFTSR
jgi:hypothetical protein